VQSAFVAFCTLRAPLALDMFGSGMAPISLPFKGTWEIGGKLSLLLVVMLMFC